jgi:hypothetical protein
VENKKVKSETFHYNFFMKNRKAQVTIFIIIAIAVVGIVALYFVFTNFVSKSPIPPSFEPVYKTFSTCLEDYAQIGVNVLESQGGYIYLPEYETGSSYIPFSSQLNFLGNPIPYWYYISNNNIPKTQVPSKSGMEKQLDRFIEEKIHNCEYNNYYYQGFKIIQGDPKADVTISNNQVTVNLNMNLAISKDNESYAVKTHSINVASNLGKLYDDAIKVYDTEQKTSFLENRSVDTLRLYAPVDGVELTCSPKIWKADEVFSELRDAIEANTLAMRTKEGTVKDNKDKYFVVDLPVDSSVRFLNSQNWTYTYDVAPSQGSLLIAQPIGNQEGLGILGFCYVPYHFVYNLKYPVLVQVSSGNEIFQFPLAVVVEGNKERKALNGTASGTGEILNFCNYKNTMTKISVYDNNMNPINANISYVCSGTVCDIGATKNGSIETYFPQCANGFVQAKADGFKEESYLYSTVNEGELSVLMSKEYELGINLKIDGVNSNSQAMIIFTSNNFSETIVYPDQKTIKLSEGQYEIEVQAFKNSTLQLEGVTKQQCLQIPQKGFGGFLGLTEQQCYDISLPSQVISSSLAGGGKQNYYILNSELQNSTHIEINSGSLPVPTSLDDLQKNYLAFGNNKLEISFK